MFLRLTQGTINAPLLVNSRQIKLIYKNGRGSTLFLGLPAENDQWTVNEPIEEIMEMINGA